MVPHSAAQPWEVVGGGNARAGRQALCCSVGRVDPHKLRCGRTPAYSDSSLEEHELTESTRGIGRGSLRTGHFGGALTLDLESVVLRGAESGLGTGF